MRAGREQWGRELKYGLQIGNGRGWRGIRLSRRTPSVLPLYAMPMTLLSSSLQERKRGIYMYIYRYIRILQLVLAQEMPADANDRRNCSARGRTVTQQPVCSHELPALAGCSAWRIVFWMRNRLGRKGRLSGGCIPYGAAKPMGG